MINNVNEKLPQECSNIDEVRSEIDKIDREIIRQISVRFGYVCEVVKYKEGTADSIEAADRRDAVINSRRQWAENEGLDPDVIEDLYNRLIKYFIEEEKKIINV